MRPLPSLVLTPFLIAATCNPQPNGGALVSLSLDQLGPLRLDPTDERFTEAPPSLEAIVVRDSDDVQATTPLLMDGTLEYGFNLLDTEVALGLPEAPCEDTRHMTVRFRLIPGEGWAETVAGEYGEVSGALVLLPDASERVETWESWTLLLTPEISFPTEVIASTEEPLGCLEDS